mmetsp:Transcript_15058/g.46777  ORF Transcript_15058/g.46777 Transcript_15058/m.46777 type:complete len:93 (+) Transcript_15058:1196-1474(+)
MTVGDENLSKRKAIFAQYLQYLRDVPTRVDTHSTLILEVSNYRAVACSCLNTRYVQDAEWSHPNGGTSKTSMMCVRTVHARLAPDMRCVEGI